MRRYLGRVKRLALDVLVKAGPSQENSDAPPYRGAVDIYSDEMIAGWTISTSTQTGGLPVALYVGPRLVRVTVADIARIDVKDAGFGDGYCGFRFDDIEELINSKRQPGEAIRVVINDGSDFEVGSIPAGVPSNYEIDLDHPIVQQCVGVLSSDAGIITRLLDNIPEDYVFHPPKMAAHAQLFEPVNSLSDKSKFDHAPSSGYIDHVKYRFRLDRDFSTDTVPADMDRLMWWYIGTYSGMREGYRIPLSAEQISYLNHRLYLGGAGATLTRAMWWFLMNGASRAVSFDQNDTNSVLKTLYWWAWHGSAKIAMEDCLVPEQDISFLSSVDVVNRNKSFALTRFAQELLKESPEFGFINAGRASDRKLFYLVMMAKSFIRPDILRYIPRQVFENLLSSGEFEKFLGTITGNGDLNFSRDRFENVLRSKGFDASSLRFLFFDPNGNRVEACALSVPGEADGECDVQVIGPFHKASGLGQTTRLTQEILKHTSFDVNCVDFPMDNPASVGFNEVGELSTYKKAKVNIIKLNGESIPLGYAYGPDVFSDAYNIGYFYWELDSPAKCQFVSMDLLDEIWVASEYGVSIYQPHTEKPVRNVGMCFEDVGTIDKMVARKKLNERFGFAGTEFVFLFAFDSFSFIQRKNPGGALRAFVEAFEGIDNVRLVIKTQNRHNVSDPVQRKIWNQVDALVADDRRIHVLDETLSYSDLLDLKAASDCYVSLHRSEGWGFGMIEAMNLKVPVVCTGYSGNLEFCTDETAFLVEAKEVLLGTDDYIFVIPGQKWAEPNHDSAVAQMRAVYENADLRAQKVEAAYEFIRSNFSAEAVAVRYEKRLQEVMKTL